MIKDFEILGISKTEAKVYITLLKHSILNGYQISKMLELSKSSVYSSLNNLYKKNIIYLVPGETNQYKAEKPEIVLERLKKNYTSSCDRLNEDLKDLEKDDTMENFFNIRGERNLIEKLRELINRSEKEICINISIEFELIEEEIRQASKRGVRIILFSFYNIDKKGIEMEVYNYSTDKKWPEFKRIHVVIDNRIALIAGSNKNNKILGAFTENPVLITIVNEHIHHDIYLSKLQKKYKNVLIEKEDRISSLSENIFFEEIDKIKY